MSAPDTRREDPEMTAAAHEVLREFLNETRDRVISMARRSNRTRPEPEAIGVREVLAAIDSLSTPGRPLSRDRLYRLLRAYAGLGVLATLAGVGYLFFVRYLPGLSPDEGLAAAVAAVGILVAALSGLLLASRARDFSMSVAGMGLEYTQANDATDEFLELWRDLEFELRDVGAVVFGDSTAQEPLSSLVKRLRSTYRFTQEDEMELRKLLRLRNEVTHSSRVVDENELADARRSAQRLHKALQTTLREA